MFLYSFSTFRVRTEKATQKIGKRVSGIEFDAN